MNFEEDTYNAIFSALKHPIRRKILRTLDQAPATYTEMLNTLGIETGLLNYHLESLSSLIAKNEENKYNLSDYGRAALSLTRRVEEPSAPREMTIARRALMAMVVGLLILAVAVTSQAMVTPSIEYHKVHESTDYGNTVYPPKGLYGLEFLTGTPRTVMHFWWKMNASVEVYVMTKDQYRVQRELHGPPTEYLLCSSGAMGNMTVTAENGTGLDIVYEFTIYTGDSWVFEEGHGFSVYYWIPVKKINYTLFALDLMITLAVITLIVFNDKLDYRRVSLSLYLARYYSCFGYRALLAKGVEVSSKPKCFISTRSM